MTNGVITACHLCHQPLMVDNENQAALKCSDSCELNDKTFVERYPSIQPPEK